MSLERERYRLGLNLSAFHSRNYRLFFLGQGLSMTGTFMTQIATVWIIYDLTHSALLLGITGFLGQLPTFLLSPQHLCGHYARVRRTCSTSLCHRNG